MTVLPHVKWTIEEYHRLIEQGFLADKKVELLRGEIIEMAPESPDHADSNGEAHEYLLLLLGDRAKVRNAKPITLPNGSEPEPDISVCERREYRSHHPYPENIFWLIEYSDSTLKKDLEIKSKIYAEAGIQEYWIVSIQTHELIVMRDPEGGEYETEFRVKSGTLNPLAFPELAIEVLKIINP
ncbi:MULTISPECIES: Uma2 family endonuclease [Leptolyngbya]|uniref:Uma2 family endonuclease n=1 Tax=Leptolyngbya TaxID=47251 RepID=UPI0016858395|nr:Uma2 family endonuclease [Leptolyngbya sp. FACHB-1624]MBD1856493.1 Uma2 family endonuclease [Leptolyngbya sp. FACHB-1624]